MERTPRSALSAHFRHCAFLYADYTSLAVLVDALALIYRRRFDYAADRRLA